MFSLPLRLQQAAKVAHFSLNSHILAKILASTPSPHLAARAMRAVYGGHFIANCKKSSNLAHYFTTGCGAPSASWWLIY